MMMKKALPAITWQNIGPPYYEYEYFQGNEGTESRRRSGAKDFQNVIADVKADCNIILVESAHGGRVHKGFSDALDLKRRED